MTVIAAAPARVATVHVARTVVLRSLTMAAAALVVAGLHVRRPATLCLFRAVTGIPCPFCGGTTAAVHLGHADLRGAVAASPLALLMFVAWPFVGVVRSPSWWHSRALRWSLIAVLLVSSEVWQLLRFGVIGV